MSWLVGVLVFGIFLGGREKAYNSPGDEARKPAVWLSIVHLLRSLGVGRLVGGGEARLALAYFFII